MELINREDFEMNDLTGEVIHFYDMDSPKGKKLAGWAHLDKNVFW